ncbi:MAG: M36 family metallopeptidase, partial [Bacteroidota bacterium]
NNQANAPGALAPGDVGDQVTIPSLMISQGLCAQLRLVENLTVSLSFEEFTEVPNPGPTGRSSDFDNGVIAHEYTHGISIRLTGGASTSGCLNNFEQAGEGWSDWFGLAMTTTSENNANQGRGIGTYAAGQPTTGGGIRPFPYTRNMNVNPHTYSDILSESVPHGVGSVWCAMIWDLYWNLVDEYGFDNDLYNGTGGNNIAMQLVLDGLKLQPCGPSFLDARDAIIAADMANNDGANLCLIWNTFARRGLGASAEVGGNEAFDLPFDCQERFKVRKTGVEAADAGSIITYTLEIANGRSEILPSEGIVIDELPTGVSFVAGSSECNITEVDGTLTINVGELGGNQTIECTYQVLVADEPFTAVLFEDDLETGSQNWATESPIGTNGWNRINSFANSGTNSFFVVNTETQSEQILVLNQPFTVGNTNPALSFWHFYNTESDWDGGVVEISTNGTNWIDLGDNMIQNGYPGALNENPDNVIGGQPAFNGNSGGWIQTIIDLSEYAGNDVQVRFRFGADAFVGGEGWYVDDIRFLDNLYTITNVACVEDSGDTFCSEVTTIVFGEVINNTTTINQAEKVSIFPNPTSGLITVQLDAPVTTAVDLQVLGIDGRVLYRQQFDSFQNTSVDLSDYGAGVYLVQLRTERGITTRRVVVE